MRNRVIDIIKGIGIVLVVLGHCNNGVVTDFIYLFHMPLFFLISGYLYHEDSSKEPIAFLKKKIKGLYIPYLLTAFSFTFLRNFLLDIGVYSSSYLYFNHYIDYLDGKKLLTTICQDVFLAAREPLGGTLWFSVVLFFVNIQFLIISVLSEKFEEKIHIEKENTRLFFVFFAFFIGNLATKLGYTIPRCNNALVMLAVYYIGVKIRQKNLEIRYNTYYIFLCFSLLVLNVFYGGISVNQNLYPSPPFLIINCLLGSYMIFGIANMVRNWKIGFLFEDLGKHSFAIMVLHYSAFMVVTKFLLFFFKNNHWYEFPIIQVNSKLVQTFLVLPYVFVGVFLPYVIARLYQNIKGIFIENMQ